LYALCFNDCAPLTDETAARLIESESRAFPVSAVSASTARQGIGAAPLRTTRASATFPSLIWSARATPTRAKSHDRRARTFRYELFSPLIGGGRMSSATRSSAPRIVSLVTFSDGETKKVSRGLFLCPRDRLYGLLPYRQQVQVQCQRDGRYNTRCRPKCSVVILTCHGITLFSPLAETKELSTIIPAPWLLTEVAPDRTLISKLGA